MGCDEQGVARHEVGIVPRLVFFMKHLCAEMKGKFMKYEKHIQEDRRTIQTEIEEWTTYRTRIETCFHPQYDW